LKSLDAVLKSHCLIDGGELGMQQIHTGGMSLEAHPLNFALSLKHFPAHINGSSQRMKKFLSPALEIERAVPI